LRKTKKRARSLVKSARWILKKKKKKLTPEQRSRLSDARAELGEALKRRDIQQILRKSNKLESLITNNFSSLKKSALREWAESIAFALILVFIIRTFIIQPYKIPTGSMTPTLLGVIKKCPVCGQSGFRYDRKKCPRDGASLEVAQTGDKILVNKFIYGAKTTDRIPFTDVLLPFLQLPAIRKPRRGDIVVFHFPEELETDYVKRLAGLPGEKIEISNGDIFIDDRAVLQPQMDKVYYTNAGEFGERGKPVLIPSAGMDIPLRQDNRWYWEEVVRVDGHRIEVNDGEILIDGESREVYTVEQDYFFLLGDNSRSSRDSRFWGFVPRKYLVGEVFFIYWPPRRWGFVK